MKFKKTVLAILCVVLCLSAFGCGSKNSGDDKKDSAQQTEQTDGNAAKDEQNKDTVYPITNHRTTAARAQTADKHPLSNRARSLKVWLTSSIIPMTPKRKRN